MVQNSFSAALIQQKTAVRMVLIVEEHVLGTRLGKGLGQFGLGCVEFRMQTNEGSVSVGEKNLHCNGPDAAFAENIPLRQGKVIDAILIIAGPGNVRLRHSTVTNPQCGPILKILSGNLFERVDKIAPLGVRVSMLLQV